MPIIIDSGIFMNTSNVPSFDDMVYMTPLVIDELQHTKTEYLFELFKAKNKVTILEPTQDNIEKITKQAKHIGQKDLSITDIHVLALCLQFDKPLLVSDDYDVRNMAHSLNIDSQGITTKGGSQLRKYKFKCLGCGKFYPNEISDCDVCGTETFKKMKK